jgi:homoserine/homoserine lactone efflux protein
MRGANELGIVRRFRGDHDCVDCDAWTHRNIGHCYECEPGPARRAADSGRTSVGNAALLAAIATGLSWVVAHAIYLFEILRWVGAVYLIWLGVQAWRSAGNARAISPSGRADFRRGFLVALSNPKPIAFFTAFLPQFIDPSLPVNRQLAVMGTVSVLLGALTDSGWATAAGLGRAWFLKSSRAKLLGRISGLTLIGGGIWLSLSRRPA